MKTSNVLAFSLVEVAIALGVAVFCLTALFGLLPTGLHSNQVSVQQTVAASLASSLIADLRAAPRTSPPSVQSSPRFRLPIPATGVATRTIFLKADGSISGAVDENANPNTSPLYRAMLVFNAAPARANPPPERKATTVRVFITWPALADRTANTTPRNYTGSFETMTALDRN